MSKSGTVSGNTFVHRVHLSVLVYDRKDNWVKKHYRSGKYQYFYFREIYFKNGDVTGSTDFDRRFINKHGNFDTHSNRYYNLKFL